MGSVRRTFHVAAISEDEALSHMRSRIPEGEPWPGVDGLVATEPKFVEWIRPGVARVRVDWVLVSEDDDANGKRTTEAAAGDPG